MPKATTTFLVTVEYDDLINDSHTLVDEIECSIEEGCEITVTKVEIQE